MPNGATEKHIKGITGKIINILLLTAISLYLGFSLVSVWRTGTVVAGEYDDYSAPVASLLNDGNFSISRSDLIHYGKVFPEWKKRIKSFRFSGFKTRWGGELTWYFPIYSIVVLPLTVLLPKVGIPALYSFCLTNFILYLAALFYVGLTLHCSRRKRMLMVALLAIHPIAAYWTWASAEVFIFSLLTVGMASWYNRQYYRASLFTAIAAMLNSTIFAANAFIGLDYLYHAIWKEGRFCDRRRFLASLLLFGLCTIPAFIPPAYNIHHTGHANLTAAYEAFLPAAPLYSLKGFSFVFARFQSYLFDLNYGFLPFFPLAFPAFLFASVSAVVKREWDVLKWVLAFFGIVAGYSVMVHINCGMSGIARYSAWSSVVFLFALLRWTERWIDGHPIGTSVAVASSIAFSATVMSLCGFIDNPREPFPMTPIARYVLDRCPFLYNPYHNTFHLRVLKKGSDSENWRPSVATIYVAKDGFIRKILATDQNRDYLEETLSSQSGDADLVRRKLETLRETPTYLSFSESSKVVGADFIPLGEALPFDNSHLEGRMFFSQGLSDPEGGWTWTSGKEARMRFRTSSAFAMLSVNINCTFYGNRQRVIVEANGTEVLNEVCSGDHLHFEFANPGVGNVTDLVFRFPDASSPASSGKSDDTRILALMIKSLTISDKTP